MDNPLSEIDLTGDDVVVPFQVDALDVRGRTIQIGPMLNSILDRHDYPAPVSALLAQVMTITILLGTSLKFEGKFIVQAESDGPVSLLIVDFTTPESVRAYARYDADAVQKAVADGLAKPEELLGKGILAMTVDQGANMQRYQGIVELNGDSLEEVARKYFVQSEQIPTQIRLASAEIFVPNENNEGSTHQWRGGGLVVQFLPESEDRMRLSDLPGGDLPEGVEDHRLSDDDAWAEAKALIDTISDDELTDPQVNAELLLYRLFHERGVRVYEGINVKDKCSCSRERIIELVKSLNKEDVEAAQKQGEISTKCEFCSTEYRLSPDEIN